MAHTVRLLKCGFHIVLAPTTSMTVLMYPTACLPVWPPRWLQRLLFYRWTNRRDAELCFGAGDLLRTGWILSTDIRPWAAQCVTHHENFVVWFPHPSTVSVRHRQVRYILYRCYTFESIQQSCPWVLARPVTQKTETTHKRRDLIGGPDQSWPTQIGLYLTSVYVPHS